ncbi:MAG TPA: MFS transporter, partial [Candidatus Obscuribacterales bacterium]
MHALRILSTHPIYRRYWVAMLISNLGNMMQGAAQSWLALQLSGSAEALGSVVALQFLPSLLLSIPAGALADSLPRRGIVQVTQFLMMVLTVLMAVLVWSGHIAFWHLLLLAFAQGCLVAVDLPARQALVVELVSKERYHEAMPL